MPPNPRRPATAGAPRSSRRRRRALEWYETELGWVPDCCECQALLFSPTFIEAVYSTCIDKPGDPVDLARRTVHAYHDHDHGEF